MAPCSWNMLPWWYVFILTIKRCVRLNDSSIYYFLNSFYVKSVPLYLDWNILFIILWCFYPIPGHGVPLRGFAISLIGHTTTGSGTLDEWSSRRMNLPWMSDHPDAWTYNWKTHHAHKRQTSTSPAGFEPSVPPNKQPHTHAFDREATGISFCVLITYPISKYCPNF